jgi:superfamily II DNA or RNA helicase
MADKKTREQIQSEALELIANNGYIGCVILSTGSGKSKVAIDAIKKGNFKNILITSPRTNLKENWRKELEKWGYEWDVVRTGYKWYYQGDKTVTYKIEIQNIQTCYKWDDDKIKSYDLVICDEAHTMVSPEYGNVLRVRAEHNLPRIGLTATPDTDSDEKRLFYAKYCPIIYEYLDSAKDGIVNKRRYFVYNYELTDDYKITAGTKAKPFKKGEKTQYEYLSNAIKKGQILMSRTGSQDWFTDAANWAWKGQGTSEQKSAAIQYLNAVKYRKEFLWNLTSSADIAVQFKNMILDVWREKTPSEVGKDDIEGEFAKFPGFKSFTPANKVLLFSELTKQANKLSKYTVHSNNDEETNKQNLFHFDSGNILELASCNSLTLGLNIKGANYAIMESFNSSTTAFAQKAGRTDRLPVDEEATVIFIVPQGTQSEQWFNNATKTLDLSDAVYLDSINDLKQYL